MIVNKTTPPLARKAQIVSAATGVFLRYGYARTTMGDIADAVGVSRTALYVIYPGKEEIFAAVIERLNLNKLEELRQAFPRLATLDRKLHFCCEEWGAHGFDLISDHPDAKDLFDLGFAPVREMYAVFQIFIAELVSSAMAGSGLNTTPEALARILVFAMRGFEETAKDGKDMRQMIAMHVEIVLAALRLGR